MIRPQYELLDTGESLHDVHEDMSLSASRFAAFADMTASEIAALMGIVDRPRDYPANATIRNEGDAANQLYFLRAGWVISSIILSDGTRQVLKVHFPGDIMGAPSLPLAASAENLRTVTRATVCIVSKAAISQIFSTMPRLAMLFFLAAQEERLLLMDRLSSIGRQSGLSRLAGFLVHVHDRLRIAGISVDTSFELPLSQELIGDVIGLSTVHTNRVFKELTTRGLIERRGRTISFPDIDAVRKLSGLPERVIDRNAPWLPPPSP